MNTLKVLIITDETIFSFGLRVQFQKWGFGRVDILANCNLAIQSLRRQKPSLVILDEKFMGEQECSIVELIVGFMDVPIIVLNAENNFINASEGIHKTNKYTYLSKSCNIAKLKAAVENLLHIHVSEL